MNTSELKDFVELALEKGDRFIFISNPLDKIDVLNGSIANDSITLGAENDTVYAKSGNALVNGDANDDLWHDTFLISKGRDDWRFIRHSKVVAINARKYA